MSHGKKSIGQKQDVKNISIRALTALGNAGNLSRLVAQSMGVGRMATYAELYIPS